ncbi:MAG: NAD-dependent malic enzyme [Xanthomonadales bacterium]|nr:NAD-dependent malic enzyme [Xanthomonadales bacterium]
MTAQFIPEDFPRGVKLLHDPARNKGTAFTQAERSALGLRGLLPPRVCSEEIQVRRVLENLRAKPSDLEKYIGLMSLQDRNETLFYRVLTENLEEFMPVIYTPTVGKACQEFGHIFRRPRGMYICSEDRGEIREVMANWSHHDVRMIVVTDGERILGLGDLGADGMGIPIGKLALYSACAGIHPTKTLPITLDVGTNNEALIEDPLYIGVPHRRIHGEEYDAFLDEFFAAASEAFPKAVIQLEDFANHNAFRLLARYRDRYCTFDDDIQGTGAVALAGLIAALRITGDRMGDRPYLFYGAGEAGIGIGDLIVANLVEEGWDEAEARRRCWFIDSRGLITAGREGLAEHKRPYAHELDFKGDLLHAIRTLEPGALIGVCGQPQVFTEPVVRAMAEINERPVIFALSNPTSKAECTAEQAYRWSDGRAVFASGSPFAGLKIGDQSFVPGQGNNAYIFPGVGLGLIAAEANRCTDRMFLAAARTLAEMVEPYDLSVGRVYPPLTRIREVSARIATAVAEIAFSEGIARIDRPDDLQAVVASHMFVPVYPGYA